MRAASVAFAAVALLAICAGCKRLTEALPASKEAEPTAPPPLVDAGSAMGPRCALGDAMAAIESAPQASLVIGEAAAVRDGFAIGITRMVAKQTQAAIAVVSPDLSSVRVRVAATTGIMPDAPTPKPIAQGDSIFALYTVLPGHGRDAGAGASLVLTHVEDARADAVANTSQAASESLGSDALATPNGVLEAWEEDAPASPTNRAPTNNASVRGLVKAALVGVKVGAGDARDAGAAPRVISPETSDAESPRLAPRASGRAWLAWLAHRSEPTADAGDRLEAPSSPRAFRWVEIVALDAHGVPEGPVRRVTSASGHIGAFDLAPRGEDAEAVDLFARDDDERAEGEGGKIVRITLHGDAVDPAVVLVDGGVGHGAIDVLERADEAWLAFTDPSDHMRLVPLTSARTSFGSPSVEPSLDGARVLAIAKAGVFLAAFPNEEKSLRLVGCKR